MLTSKVGVGSWSSVFDEVELWNDWNAYISGSFFTSITAAIGMPKFEAGPQKSIDGESSVLIPKN